uniref:Uncharacterized protein n=1 Tax=Arundo donax TaxID=35708 RepID=A0A0A8Y788_ARUDO
MSFNFSTTLQHKNEQSQSLVALNSERWRSSALPFVCVFGLRI